MKWQLCMKHAIITAQWALENEEAMKKHAELERAMNQRNKMQRAADRIETKLKKQWHEKEHYVRSG